MTPLWTAADAAAATGGTAHGAWSVAGVSTDSRAVAPDDLFVALSGDSFDGHDFVPQALASGAAAVLVARPVDGPSLLVEDTLKGLADLGIAARARSDARVVAVTGSVGKTGTKEALASVLSRQAPTEASRGNLNNHIGTPLSLARLTPAARYAVFELGMNHPGEIAPLARMVRPHVAIITAIAAAHTEFFPDLGGIADEKAAILDGLEPDGTAILTADTCYRDRLVDQARQRGVRRIVSFGEHAGADFRLLDYRPDENGGTVEASVAGRVITYRIGAAGRHWAVNSLAVLAAAEALGADLDRAAADLAGVTAPKGRGQRRDVVVGDKHIALVDESYNASPAAMRAAIAVLDGMVPAGSGRRVAVLGDMLELGPTAPRLHAELAGPLAASGIELIVTIGPLMRHLHDALPPKRRGGHFANSAAAAEALPGLLRDGDAVTVKGSLGSKMAVIVEALAKSPAGVR